MLDDAYVALGKTIHAQGMRARRYRAAAEALDAMRRIVNGATEQEYAILRPLEDDLEQYEKSLRG